MNINDFLIQFPEFRTADVSLVKAMLEASLLEIDVGLWRAKADQGQAYLTAHRLAMSPFGQNARLAAKDGNTTYNMHFKELRSQVASGFRVC